MSIFYKLVSKQTKQNTLLTADYDRKEFVFQHLPESLEEMKALPEAALQSPFQTAALTVCALCSYAADKKTGTEMLNWLRGPRPLSNFDLSFLDDRLRDGKTYVPFSYFQGATPDNDYFPSQPFKLIVESNPTSDDVQGYFKVTIRSGGADTPRSVQLRQKSDGIWLLWEQYLMADIRLPKTMDPWM
jgi:hypothetical protein